jgi:hypothetical protein
MKTRNADSTAARLGWFSIALGLAELLMTRRVARFTGMQGREGLLRAYGVREVATGVGLLTAKRREPWLWARVAGDALDLATLSQARNKGRAAAAMAAVAGVAAIDVQAARALGREREQRAQFRDYSDRSGFPRPAAQMRGVASDVARQASGWMRRPESQSPPAQRTVAS